MSEAEPSVEQLVPAPAVSRGRAAARVPVTLATTLVSPSPRGPGDAAIVSDSPDAFAARPARPTDAAAENEAYSEILRALVQGSGAAWEAIAAVALRLCRAGSAGISVVAPAPSPAGAPAPTSAGAPAPDRSDGASSPKSCCHLDRPAVAGALAGRLPPHGDAERWPCGDALSAGGPLLVENPTATYPSLARLDPPVHEAVVVPVAAQGRAVATLWVLAHDPAHRFDAEDARLLTRLAEAAAVAWQQARADEARARAEAEGQTLDALMEYLPEGLAIADAEGLRVRRVSRYGRELTGRRADEYLRLAPDREPTNDRLLHPGGALVAVPDLPLMRAMTQGEVIRNEEYLLLRADGTPLPILCNAGPIRAADGRVTGALVAWRDVEELKRNEQALRESRARAESFARAAEAGRASLAATVENLASGVIVLDADGRVLLVNRACTRLLGLGDGAPVGVGHVRDFARQVRGFDVRGDELPFERWPAVRALAGERVIDVEMSIRRREGGALLFTGRFGAVPLRDEAGRVVQVVVTLEDVTEVRRREDVLRESEERLRLALETARLGLWQHYLRAGNVRLDERARQHFGLDREFVTLHDIFEHVHPEDRGVLRAAMERAFDPATRSNCVVEYRTRDASGALRWLSVFGHVHFDGPGADARAVLALGTTQDITERKLNEQALRESERSLREADRAKDVFLATLAHELRNPLAPVRNAVRVLASTSVGAREQQWGREVIERQVATMARLLDDLLDVSRITQGKLELRRERVLLATILEGAIETSRPLLDARGHELRVLAPEADVWLEVDGVRLCQVVANLLNNAAKYTLAGGHVELRASVTDGEVCIEVADDGIGLAPEALARIFRMFTQVHASRSHAEGGLGIGLALARGLVELHGGRLEAASAGPGLGSTFTLRLPCTPAARGGATGGAGGAARPAPRRRILVVDDNRDAAESLALLLQLEGHELRIAHSGAEALELAPAFRPEIAFLDIGMPGMDGYALADRLRRLGLPQRPTLVAVTGWGQSDDRRRALDAGFDHHFTKPVAPELLDEVVRSLAC